MKRIHNIDLIIVALLTILSLILLITPQLNDKSIIAIFEYLLMLFLPGYSFTTILFPIMKDLKIIERIGLSFVISIVITLLIGVILSLILSETKIIPILISISIFTLFMLPISFLRRKQISESFSLNINESFKSFKSSFKTKSRRNKIISISLLVFFFIAASMTIFIILSTKENEKFTEFYILGPDGKANNYPTNLTFGQTGTVNIGIVNHEQSEVTYKLIIKLNNQILSDQDLNLQNNEKKETTFSFTPSQGNNQKIEFFLYKLPDNKNIYRYLFLQFNVN